MGKKTKRNTKRRKSEIRSPIQKLDIQTPKYSRATDLGVYYTQEKTNSPNNQNKQKNQRKSSIDEQAQKFMRKHLSRDKLKERRKESKGRKNSSENQKPSKNYSLIIEKIEESFNSNTNPNSNQQDNPKDNHYERYRPTNIQDKLIPPLKGARRHSDMVSYVEARNKLKLRNKGPKDILVKSTHQSFAQTDFESERSSNIENEQRIIYNQEKKEVVGLVKQVNPMENIYQNHDKIHDHDKRDHRKEDAGVKDSVNLYKKKRKRKKLKDTGSLNKNSLKKSYTSFMRSGNFEKQFSEELKIKPKKEKKNILKTSLEKDHEVFKDFKQQREMADRTSRNKISNLELDSNMIQDEESIGTESTVLNDILAEPKLAQTKEIQNVQASIDKVVINIYKNQGNIGALNKNLPNKEPLPSENDIQRVSDFEKDSNFFEYSEITSTGMGPSRQSKNILLLINYKGLV